MTISNRLQFVDRERINGHIDGIDFGYNLSCIARSPDKALFWCGGSGYWSSRGQPYSYGASHLLGFDRAGSGLRLGKYERIGEEGGKLTEARVRAMAEKLVLVFDDRSIVDPIAQAIRERKTLLIEGGGQPFTPRTT